jgi:hypothetical protein
MQPRYDFSRFWLNESLADTLVLIRIDGDVKQRIPGHGIVLANGNAMLSVLQQQLISWSYLSSSELLAVWQ